MLGGIFGCRWEFIWNDSVKKRHVNTFIKAYMDMQNLIETKQNIGFRRWLGHTWKYIRWYWEACCSCLQVSIVQTYMK